MFDRIPGLTAEDREAKPASGEDVVAPVVPVPVTSMSKLRSYMKETSVTREWINANIKKTGVVPTTATLPGGDETFCYGASSSGKRNAPARSASKPTVVSKKHLLLANRSRKLGKREGFDRLTLSKIIGPATVGSNLSHVRIEGVRIDNPVQRPERLASSKIVRSALLNGKFVAGMSGTEEGKKYQTSGVVQRPKHISLFSTKDAVCASSHAPTDQREALRPKGITRKTEFLAAAPSSSDEPPPGRLASFMRQSAMTRQYVQNIMKGSSSCSRSITPPPATKSPPETRPPSPADVVSSASARRRFGKRALSPREIWRERFSAEEKESAKAGNYALATTLLGLSSKKRADRL